MLVLMIISAARDLFRTDDLIRTRVNVAVRSGRVTRVAGLF